MEESDARMHIKVEVAYALPQKQRIVALQVPEGTTALDAVLRSGIAREFPEIDPATASMGIFAKPLDGKALPLPAAYALQERDRVEIYRPLLIDPKEARLARAAKLKAAKLKDAKLEEAKLEDAKLGEAKVAGKE